MNDAATNYLDANRAYWERGYVAPHVDACVFRFYGRILKPDFKLVGSGETVVDFGCGQGAAVNFFNTQGFDAWGCDISKTDIDAAKIRYPHLSRKLSLVNPSPADNECYCVSSNIRVVTGIQSFYYLSDTDFAICIEKLYGAMQKGAVFLPQ
jgi:SAM-dependent methyltransferase